MVFKRAARRNPPKSCWKGQPAYVHSRTRRTILKHCHVLLQCAEAVQKVDLANGLTHVQKTDRARALVTYFLGRLDVVSSRLYRQRQSITDISILRLGRRTMYRW